MTPRQWPLDHESPFEKKRVLNPAPSRRIIRKTRKIVDRLFPQLAATEIVEDAMKDQSKTVPKY